MLEVRNLSKSYETPRGPLPILEDVSFSLNAGDALSIAGPSGTGKSTLLYVLGALDPPTAGTVTLDGVNPYQLNEKKLAAFRNRQVGFVFQDHCLLPQLNVLENVLVPSLVAEEKDDFAGRARELLARVGLADRLEHRPGELSGGEKQRGAIARALLRQPKLLLCDEPTGNLDRENARQVADLLLEINQQMKTILVVVTHSAELAARFPLRREMAGRQLAAR